MQTQLLYLEHMDQYTCTAHVVEILDDAGKAVVILDQTVFYPQGGGQPYDTGTISGSGSGKVFRVSEVRYVDGIVRHIGTFEGEAFAVGDAVECTVDVERRKLNTRLHSAGHVLDMGMALLEVTWKPGKGYHFPDGPYVEYAGSLDGVDVGALAEDLEAACGQIIGEGVATKVVFMPREAMGSVCRNVPEHIPDGKPGRVVMYGSFGVPCGGTHVANLAEIGKLTIRKVKQRGGDVRVSYAVE